MKGIVPCLWERGGHLQREHEQRWSPLEGQTGISGPIGGPGEAVAASLHRWIGKGCTEEAVVRQAPKKKTAWSCLLGKELKGQHEVWGGLRGVGTEDGRGRATGVVPCQDS